VKKLIEAIIYELEMFHAETDEDIDWVKDELRRYRKMLKDLDFNEN